MSEPEHIGAIIARCFLELEERVKAGDVKAHPACTCKPELRLVEPAEKIFMTVILHDDACPAITGRAA